MNKNGFPLTTRRSLHSNFVIKCTQTTNNRKNFGPGSLLAMVVEAQFMTIVLTYFALLLLCIYHETKPYKNIRKYFIENCCTAM